MVYAWRGDDRSAALELLPALAYASLAGDTGETARIIAEYGRIELEARRFNNVAMLFRLFARDDAQARASAARGAAHEDQSLPGAEPDRRA